jgi:hypothetical protein
MRMWILECETKRGCQIESAKGWMIEKQKN